MLERFLRLLENIFPPVQQLLTEILALPFTHERLFLARPVRFYLFGAHLLRLPSPTTVVFVCELRSRAALYRPAPGPTTAKGAVSRTGSKDYDTVRRAGI